MCKLTIWHDTASLVQVTSSQSVFLQCILMLSFHLLSSFPVGCSRFPSQISVIAQTLLNCLSWMKCCNFKGFSWNLDIWNDMCIMCQQDWDCGEKTKGHPLSICGSDDTTWQIQLWHRAHRSERHFGHNTGTGLLCFPPEQQGQRIQRISWPQV